MGQRIYNQDKELIFKDAGAVTSSGAATVDGSAKVIKVGPGRFEAVMLFDVSAVSTGADNGYFLAIQGSDTENFSGAVENLALVDLGNTAVRPGGADTSKIGRFEVPFTTEVNDVIYDYVRVYVVVDGTDASVNFSAWASTKY